MLKRTFGQLAEASCVQPRGCRRMTSVLMTAVINKAHVAVTSGSLEASAIRGWSTGARAAVFAAVYTALVHSRSKEHSYAAG